MVLTIKLFKAIYTTMYRKTQNENVQEKKNVYFQISFLGMIQTKNREDTLYKVASRKCMIHEDY